MMLPMLPRVQSDCEAGPTSRAGALADSVTAQGPWRGAAWSRIREEFARIRGNSLRSTGAAGRDVEGPGAERGNRVSKRPRNTVGSNSEGKQAGKPRTGSRGLYGSKTSGTRLAEKDDEIQGIENTRAQSAAGGPSAVAGNDGPWLPGVD